MKNKNKLRNDKKGIPLVKSATLFISSVAVMIISFLIIPSLPQIPAPGQDNLYGAEKDSTSPARTAQPTENDTGGTAGQPAIPISLEKAVITRVVDGDTVYVRFENNEEQKLRFIGVDTPETVHPEKEVEDYGKEASDFTKSKLNDKVIYMEKDVSETDRYGRLLRYVWLTPPSFMSESEIRSKLFNAILVLNGYAQAATFPPDVKYADYFVKFQDEARKNEKGLWGGNSDIQEPVPAKPPATPPAVKQPDTSDGAMKQTYLTSPVRQGQNATITIHGQAGVKYRITVTYKSGSSTAKGLEPKTAGKDGKVTWTWKVGSKTTPGQYPITVTGDGKTFNTYFTVTD